MLGSSSPLTTTLVAQIMPEMVLTPALFTPLMPNYWLNRYIKFSSPHPSGFPTRLCNHVIT